MAKIESYPLHGGQLQQIAERFGIPVAQLLDFSANINPDGPPSSVLSTLRASLDDLSALTEYPDLQLTEIKQAIASYARVDTVNIIVAKPVPAAPEGSLELELHRLGHPYLFLDAETLGDARLGALSIRLPKYDSNKVAEPDDVYSGLLFIDRMNRATHV